MKRMIGIFLIAVMVFAICGCTSVSADQTVTLTYITDNQNIQVTLTDEEAEKVISILDGNFYDPTSGTPSCGFTEDRALTVGSRTYAIAGDACNYIKDCGNSKYFTISDEDMTYIHELFLKYNGESDWF